MQQLMQFISHHWVLVLFSALAFAWVMIEEARRQAGNGASLNPQETIYKMNHEDAVVLDIRDKALFVEGHITAAVSVPKKELEADLKKLEQYRSLPLIIVCRRGRTALEVLSLLKKNKFDKLYVLAGGMEAWSNAGLPLVKGDRKDGKS